MDGWSHSVPLEKSQIFVSGIPRDALEDELIPFFTTIGVVLKFKLLTIKNSLYNSGCAVVTYCHSRVAEVASKALSDTHFNGIILTMEKVSDNCRLYLGGIPETKSKDEVWKTLIHCGITGIVDVIMYKSYRKNCLNRGYVFVEFRTYVEAAQTRLLHKNLILWGQKMVIEWSVPLPAINDDIMSKVKILFIRNIKVTMPEESFELLIKDSIGNIQLEKVYKFKDYAFIHFLTRNDAQHALELLQGNNQLFTMYTTEEQIEFYTWYLEGSSLRQVAALFSVQYPNRPIPSHSTIANAINKLKTCGCINTIHNKKRSKRPRVITEDLKLNVVVAYVEPF
ncbi:heterogeneous nuclear ribonucleoprotein [Holotrichia oblita]|uniref:Heterogeneous nuclear ribonucleoprotein n=1 Tax=Holotrichia oblita TaxID=644536 RepID=A0ACB9SLD3_HOLOL|nr:heterogeneous nuclear ribonucleoprotein [Holotrichia oblita]